MQGSDKKFENEKSKTLMEKGGLEDPRQMEG